MTNEERKERLGRLRELNLRALGVSSFEEPLVCVQTASGGSVTLQLLAELIISLKGYHPYRWKGYRA